MMRSTCIRRNGAYGLPICQGLNETEKLNYLHKSTFNSYTFQADLPRLPIPSLSDTLTRYLASLKAQKGSVISEADIDKQAKLILQERKHLEKLHERLLAFDDENQDTNYMNAAWTDMYLKDRTPLPLNVTPFIGIKRSEDEKLNNHILRATNIILTSVRMDNTLSNEYLEPELFPIAKKGPEVNSWNSARKRINFVPKGLRFLPPVGGFTVPLGLRTIMAYPTLKAAPLDMSQYKNLFKSTRIPGKDLDSIKKFEKSDHVLIMCRGRFYKLKVKAGKNSDQILNPIKIQNAVQQIWDDANSQEYNEDSLAYLSSTNRNDWAEIRQQLVDSSSENAEALNSIDSAIFNLVLEDEEKSSKPMALDVSSTEVANSTFLWGNGANRWWDKSHSWIVTKGGDAGLTFEHAWGDGVAVMRALKEVYEETTGSNNKQPVLNLLPSDYNDNQKTFGAVPWEEITFDLDSNAESAIQKAKERYNKAIADVNVGAQIVDGIGKNFFKSNKLGGDAVIQLIIQAAYKKCSNNEVCPAYQSVSTSAFLHGRTENLRPCSEASAKAASLLALAGSAKNMSYQNYAEIEDAIRESAKYHNILKEKAQVGQGFDRHIFGLRDRAIKENLGMPLAFDYDNNETWSRMNHFILSTSTLDMPFNQGGGFGNVVPDGLGVGYLAMDDRMACNVVSTKSTEKVSSKDFALAFEEVLSTVREVFDSEYRDSRKKISQ